MLKYIYFIVLFIYVVFNLIIYLPYGYATIWFPPEISGPVISDASVVVAHKDLPARGNFITSYSSLTGKLNWQRHVDQDIRGGIVSIKGRVYLSLLPDWILVLNGSSGNKIKELRRDDCGYGFPISSSTKYLFIRISKKDHDVISAFKIDNLRSIWVYPLEKGWRLRKFASTEKVVEALITDRPFSSIDSSSASYKQVILRLDDGNKISQSVFRKSDEDEPIPKSLPHATRKWLELLRKEWIKKHPDYAFQFSRTRILKSNRLLFVGVLGYDIRKNGRNDPSRDSLFYNLYGIEAKNGRIVWQQKIYGLSDLTLYKGKIFVAYILRSATGDISKDKSYLMALDSNTGNLLWKNKLLKITKLQQGVTVGVK